MPSFGAIPRVVQFHGRIGVVRVVAMQDGWAWRLKGLHAEWRGPTESVAEALHQAAEDSLLSMPEAQWREVAQ